jgi:hypothetical protein
MCSSYSTGPPCYRQLRSELSGNVCPTFGQFALHRAMILASARFHAEDKKMQRQRLFTASSLLIVASMVANAQSAPRSDEVTGMSGTVKVLPNAKVGQTTVVFTSNTPLSSNSNQIVFVLQEKNSSLPPAWSGKARVLTGDGFVGIVADAASGQNGLFMFSDRDVPRSLSNLSFHLFNVYGIARYGEAMPLTTRQIDCLASTGRRSC